MIEYRYVFVVLVYKNTQVLSDFFRALNTSNAKVIVVNSYYDDESLSKCKVIAESNNSDFIAIPNKGYGYGNNVGCKYAMEHYSYEYLIISNSDIEIENMEALNSFDEELAVYAPHVVIPSGKRQNPNIISCFSLYYNLLKQGYKTEKKWMLKIARALCRLHREIILLISFVMPIKKLKIFAPHGCFIIFTKKAVEKLFPIFNEEMFLYNEEMFLGFNCKKNNIPVYYVPELKVLHLEGASSSNKNNMGYLYNKQSFEILDKWRVFYG